MASAADIHAAHLGRANAHFGNPLSHGRIHGDELVKRYGIWVHRAITINSTAAASVQLRFFRRSNSRTASFLRGLGVKCRPLDHPTKAYLRGRMALTPGSVAKHMIAGDVENFEEIHDSESQRLLQDVNPWTEGYQFREAIFTDLQIFGNAYNHITFDQRNKPMELWRMMPQKVKIIPSPTNFIERFELGTGPDMQKLSTEEVLWYHSFDPADPWSGFSPLEAWFKTVEAAYSIVFFQEWLFNRGGSPDYVITTERGLDEKQKRSFMSQWKRLFGKLMRREENVAFLENSAKLERLGQTQRELDFTASADQKRDEIGQAFGVPKSMLTTDDINRSNARESSEQHFRNLWPMIHRVEDVWNERLLPLMGDLIVIHENPIPDDRELRINERPSKLQAGWTINEVRAEDGMEPLADENADKPMVKNDLVLLDMTSADPESEGEGDGTDADVEATEGPLALTTADIVALGNAVRGGALTVEAARSFLVLAFGLTPEQAAAMIPEEIEPEPEELAPDDEDSPGSPPAGQRDLSWTENGTATKFIEDYWYPDDAVVECSRIACTALAQSDLPITDYPPSETIDVAAKLSVGQPLTRREATYVADEFAKLPNGLEKLLLGGSVAQHQTRHFVSPEKVYQSDSWHKAFAGDSSGEGLEQYDNPGLQRKIEKVYRDWSARTIERLEGIDNLVKQDEDRPMSKAEIEKVLPEAEIPKLTEELAEAVRPEIVKTIKQHGTRSMTEALDAAGASQAPRFNLRSRRAQDYIRDASWRIGTDGATIGWREELKTVIADAIENGEGIREIIQDIESVTSGAIVGYRAERIARTETAFGSTLAIQEGWAQSGVVAGRQFVLSADPCPWCIAVAEELGDGLGAVGDSKTVPLFQPMLDLGTELVGRFETADGEIKERNFTLDYEPVPGQGLVIPAVHPGCRCSSRPILIGEA